MTHHKGSLQKGKTIISTATCDSKILYALLKEKCVVLDSYFNRSQIALSNIVFPQFKQKPVFLNFKVSHKQKNPLT